MILLLADNSLSSQIKEMIGDNISCLKETFILTENHITKDARVCICWENDIKSLELLKNLKIPVVTCGMNGKNTVTISSITDESCSITLQRSLTDIDKNVIEPAEFPLKLKNKYHTFSIMAAVVLNLLEGKTPCEI